MPEIVISNTTPLITLMGLGDLDILRKLYGRIVVPNAVFEEIESGKSKVAYQPLRAFDWIEIRSVLQTKEVTRLLDTLDRGEAEVIVLAKELNAHRVLLDEKAARQVATLHGVNFTGTLGVLLKAHEQKMIPRVEPLLTQMQKNGIWISNTLRNMVLSQTKEI